LLIDNHPGDDSTPSRADIQMTQAIVEVANPLGMAVQDHNIVGKPGPRASKGCS
jgi:DNA repair protein RadC